MIVLLNLLLAIVLNGHKREFLDHPPVQKTVGKCFTDNEQHFSILPTAPTDVRSLFKIPVSKGEFQHMAAIGWTRSDGRIDYLCGGSLITWRYILTAAHCAVHRDIPPDTTRLGDTNLESNEDDEYAQQIGIAHIIKHPQYRESKKYHDIALIKLQELVQGNEAINVACVWREYDAPSDLLEAVGFGALGFGEKLSSTLQKVQLRPLDTTACAERIPTRRRQMPEGLREDQMCAYSETMDTCEGDSGGPLQTELHDVFGKVYPQLVGVVSFGTRCTDGSSGVYTRVSSYLNWIEKEVNQSLSYELCIRSYWGNRKKNPTISAEVKSNYPVNRVGLLWEKTETDIYQCGGVLIDYQYVLTSAECVTTSKGYPRFVAWSPFSDRATVENVFVHPKYQRESPNFDIALVKLRQYANPQLFKPLCPWTAMHDDDWNGSPVQFGASISTLNGEPSEFRIYVQTTLHKYKRCAGKNNQLCIRREVALIPGLCEIDYGGPVLTELNRNEYKVLGILTRATQGCGSNVIFTSIAPHWKWIMSIIFKNPPKKHRNNPSGAKHHHTNHRSEEKCSFSPRISPRNAFLTGFLSLYGCRLRYH